MWDFDVSPENKLATINAGPPVKKSVKAPKKKDHGSEGMEEAFDEDTPGAAESAELVWWEYGLGPHLTDGARAQKATASKGRGQTASEEVAYQHDENCENATSYDEHSYQYPDMQTAICLINHGIVLQSCGSLHCLVLICS